MKKYILLILIILSFTFISQAQWQSEVRLTNDPAASNYSRVTANGNIVHVVWKDAREGNSEIYYKRSTNTGLNWGIDTKLSNAPNQSNNPTVFFSNSIVHVVWYDLRDGNSEIYYIRSNDDGSTWGTEIRLTNNIANSIYPSVSGSGTNVNIVWEDTRDGYAEVYYKRSTDSGLNWETDTRLSNEFYRAYSPCISVSGSLVHVVWSDTRDGSYEIYYKLSTNGGLNWGADTRMTFALNHSSGPLVFAIGLFVHIIWADHRDGNFEIYYKRSTNGGTTWEPDMRLSNNSFDQHPSTISGYGPGVHIAWSDLRLGNDEIFYKSSTNAGMSWGADTGLTYNGAFSWGSSLSVSGTAVHVVWEDERDGNFEIYYKRNPTGNPIGIININTEIPKHFSLEQNYPNPFNPTTKIKFQIPKSGFVNMVVYDVLAREIATLVNEELSLGTYEADWDASNYPSGVYYYKLSGGDYSETKKMVLIK